MSERVRQCSREASGEADPDRDVHPLERDPVADRRDGDVGLLEESRVDEVDERECEPESERDHERQRHARKTRWWASVLVHREGRRRIPFDPCRRYDVAEMGPAKPVSPFAATRTDGQTETSERTSLARPWNVICHDDPVTPMSYVIQVFMRVFGYLQPKAQRLMLEVHNTGRSVVWTGSRETAEVYVQKLHGRQLRATLEHTDD